MVVLSRPALDHFSRIETFNATALLQEIPIINFSDPNAPTLLVKACEEFGFFKVVNHGVPMEFMMNLENESLKFFNLAQSEKEKSGPPDPFGYGCKRIGLHGDVGWVEYLLLTTNPDIISPKSLSIFEQNPDVFRYAVNEYVSAVKNLACEVLEMIANGLKIEPKNVISRMLRDEKSDSCFRLNYYPPWPELQGLSGKKLVGFGEHTDPQVISVLRSNNSSGLQICLKDGTWVSVPPDSNSFFFLVGDSLQVMTNGKFKSVKHRVMTDHKSSRLSMIFFGGPPLSERIAPLSSLMEKDEESLYHEFTWSEFKKSVYNSKLSDYRLGPFEKTLPI